MSDDHAVAITANKQATSVGAVENFLLALALRLRIVKFLNLASLWSASATVLLCFMRAAAYVLHAQFLTAIFSWSALAIAVVLPTSVSAIIAWRERYEPIRLARFVDDQLGLKDRIASALSVRLLLMETTFADRITGDAARAVSLADVRKLVPYKLGWRQVCALVALALCVLVLIIPSSPLSPFSLRFVRLVQELDSTSTYRGQQVMRPAVSPTLVTSDRSGEQQVHPSGQTNTHSGSQPQRTSVPQAGKSSGSAALPSGDAGEAQKNADLSSAINALNRMMGGSSHGGQSSSSAKDGRPAQSSAKMSGASSLNQGQKTSDGNPNNERLQTLGDKLRQFADRLASHRLSSQEQQDAANSLDDVNHKLDSLSMPKTQGKLNDAEQDLNDSRQSDGVTDIRSAAYYADHEGATPPSGQSGQSGQLSKDAVVIPAKAGQNSSGSGEQSNGTSGASGQSSSPGAGGSGADSTDENSKSTNSHGITSGKNHSGLGYGGGSQRPQFGVEHEIDPSKLGNAPAPVPITLPITTPNGRSEETTGTSEVFGTKTVSVVPYEPGVVHYQGGKESAVAGDQVPPAYRDVVRKYFLNLAPTSQR